MVTAGGGNRTRLGKPEITTTHLKVSHGALSEESKDRFSVSGQAVTAAVGAPGEVGAVRTLTELRPGGRSIRRAATRTKELSPNRRGETTRGPPWPSRRCAPLRVTIAPIDAPMAP